jgi:hypothetical protein
LDGWGDMITKSEALRIAKARLAAMPPLEDDELIILESATRTIRSGWVFFYQSRLYIETNCISYALAGNAPLIVSRISGRISFAGTAHPIKQYIEEHEREHELPSN